MILNLNIEGRDNFSFDVKKLLMAGYTARDQEWMKRHVAELKKAGAPAPQSVPEFFPQIADRITTADKIEVLFGNATYGEAEFVLIFDGAKIYVGVGSDHTDQVLLKQKQNLLAAKNIYPNVISAEVWPYEEVEEYWDELLLRSWVEKDAKQKLYQEAKLGKLMKVEDLISRIKKQITGDLSGTVFYSGTVSPIDGELCFGPYFKAELIDEKRGKSLCCSYSVEPIKWFRGEMDNETGGCKAAE